MKQLPKFSIGNYNNIYDSLIIFLSKECKEIISYDIRTYIAINLEDPIILLGWNILRNPIRAIQINYFNNVSNRT